MAENDERESFISDLPTEEDNMHGSQVSISECDNVQSIFSDLDPDCGNQEYLVLNPIKENYVVEIIWHE